MPRSAFNRQWKRPLRARIRASFWRPPNDTDYSLQIGSPPKKIPRDFYDTSHGLITGDVVRGFPFTGDTMVYIPQLPRPKLITPVVAARAFDDSAPIPSVFVGNPTDRLG